MHLRGTIKFHSRLGSNIIMQQKSDVCLSEIFDRTLVETEQEEDDVDTKNAATTNNNNMLMRMRSFDRKLKKRPPLCKTSSLNSHVLLDIPEVLIGMNSDPSLPVDHDEGNDDTFAISLEFKDVSYKLTLNGTDKRIVHGVTGSVRPGQVLALMGPSGSGKTTLLNLLSGRLKHNTGTITYNRRTYTKSLKQNIGFVLQNDLVFPHLTVKETLTYSALLRLPNSLSTEEKKDRAKLIISELGLERCQDSMIGGVSGGERKRACIGIEILLDPSLLFLDEPTSGLDSTNAARIVGMLRRMARDGRKAVVATIHQPSSRLFREFDELILLGNVGCSLYFGKASEAMVYFSEIGWAPLVAMTQAEFLIDLANGNVKDKSVPLELEDGNGGPSPVDVCEFLLGAYESRASSIDKSPVSLKQSRVVERQSKRGTKEWGATWTAQFSILVERGLKERRHEYLSSLRIIQVVSTAIIVGLLWWDSDPSSTKRVQDQAGLLFFVSVFWAFFPVFTAVFTFPQERAMLVKERSVNMYKLSAYLVARNTSDLPLDLLLPVVFLFIVYFMVGLKLSFSAFSLTLMSMFLSIIAAQGLGLCIGAAFMDVKKATTFASVTVMTFMLSGGFLIKRVPPFISWIRYASLNYHTYRLLLKIQYDCESRFIKSEKLHDDGGITEVGAMLVMVIGYRLMTYVLLRRMKLRADA